MALTAQPGKRRTPHPTRTPPPHLHLQLSAPQASTSPQPQPQPSSFQLLEIASPAACVVHLTPNHHRTHPNHPTCRTLTTAAPRTPTTRASTPRSTATPTRSSTGPGATSAARCPSSRAVTGPTGLLPLASEGAFSLSCLYPLRQS